MQAVVLLVHLVICVALIGLVLLQRSEGGALGIGGGSGALMTGRGAADTLARMTSFAGAFFLLTSLGLTAMSGAAHQGRSIFDALPASRSAPLTTTAPAPINPTPAAPDPTQSSAPEALPPTELAAIETTAPAPTPNPVTVAPAPNLSAAHAGPVRQASATPTPTRTQPATTAPANRPPAQTTAPRNTATTAPALNIPGVQLQGTGAGPVQTNPTRSPGNTTGATPAIAVPNPESSQSSLEAVRRERAGPDQ